MDASNVGLGAILLQEHEGKERMVGYASHILRAEKRYESTRKELLAVVTFVKHFRAHH